MTPLDIAHGAMEAAPEDDDARLRFYERLGDAELVLLLDAEADGETVSPQVFPVEGTSFVLAFDREERLSEFAEKIVPHVALSGRALVSMLTGQSLGIGLNLGVAPSSILIPPSAVEWLHSTLSQRPDEARATPSEITPPMGLPDSLITALDAKLATATGLAQIAYLAGVTYTSGAKGHMLAFVGAEPGAETALAQAANEALVFSGIEAGSLDVAFFDATHPVTAAFAKQALRFDLPQPIQPAHPPAPGSDPDKPPKL